MKFTRSFLLWLVFLPLFSGCNNDEPAPHYESINEWMYSEMSYWYFWANELPANPDFDLPPDHFYQSLLSPKDRFSFYSENYQELLDRLKGVSLESGFEFKLYRENESSANLFMQVSYIKPGSPADQLGLLRGDLIDQINGKQLTDSNYRNLLSSMNESYSIVYRRYSPSSETFEEQASLTIHPVVFAENPVFLDSTYQIEGKKIGYLIYNFFAPGPAPESDAYDQQLETAFLSFRNQGIDEFILDLRFNSGGSETSVRNLASLMVKNASPGDLMFKKQYNPVVEDAFLNHEDFGSDYLNVRFKEKAGNIGHNLSSNSVYVITSGRSASASEVVINSLKPYMDVVLIGETTVGKDAGSITIYDDENPDNTWAIQPIVVKLVNSNGEDYPNGFAPNIEQRDNFMVLQPLGSVDEPLLSIALAVASGGPVRTGPMETMPHESILNSIDAKAVSNRFILE